MNWDFLAQIGIPVFGLSGMILIARKNKWGFVLGLLAQPCWFYTAYIHTQVGVVLNSIAYTAIYCYGLYNWFRPDPARRQPSENPIESVEETPVA